MEDKQDTLAGIVLGVVLGAAVAASLVWHVKQHQEIEDMKDRVRTQCICHDGRHEAKAE